MEKRTSHQIIITTDKESRQRKFPLKLLLLLIAGIIVGAAVVFGLFWGIEFLSDLKR